MFSQRCAQGSNPLHSQHHHPVLWQQQVGRRNVACILLAPWLVAPLAEPSPATAADPPRAAAVSSQATRPAYDNFAGAYLLRCADAVWILP